MDGLVTRLHKWAASPFNEQQSLLNWVMFTILIVSITYLWIKVLEHIHIASEV